MSGRFDFCPVRRAAMRPYKVFSFGMIACAALLPSIAIGQKNAKKGEGQSHSATAQDYTTLSRYGEITAKLAGSDLNKNTITIRIDTPHAVKNTATVSTAKKTKGKSTAKPNVSVQTDHVEYELPLKDKAPVRKLYIAFEFDEKGNPKELSATEKLKLKGTGNLPGYMAKLDELPAGTVVKLQLEAPKKAASAKKDEEPELSSRPTVKMVTALSEPKDPSKTATPAKKTK